MGRKKDYSEGKRRFVIIRALLCNGAVPYDSMKYIPGSTEMLRRVIRQMIQDGTVCLHKSEQGHKFLVLRPAQKLSDEIRENIPSEYLEYYENVSQSFRAHALKKTNIARQERMLANADAAIFFDSVGQNAYPQERPYLFWKDVRLDSGISCYYNSREIKGTPGSYEVYIIDDLNYDNNGELTDMETQSHKTIIGSRLHGVYITPDADYFDVYDIGSKSIVWSKNGEFNMRRHVEQVLSERGCRTNEGAVFLYTGNAVLEQVMNQKFRPDRKRNLLNIDMVYPHTYFIPQSKDGVLMMQWMSSRGWKERMLKTVLPEHTVAADPDFDGFDRETRTFYCGFVVPDLTNLKRFVSRAKLKQPEDRFIIVAYEFQKTFIESELAMHGDSIEARYIPFYEYVEKYKKMFGGMT